MLRIRMVPGSGTVAAGPGPVSGMIGGVSGGVSGGIIAAEQPSAEISLVSRVTAPMLAKALPHAIFAPVVSVMLVCARILPWKRLWVPRVAELPTCQKMFPVVIPLAKMTVESLAVVRVLPI